jgi:hypothetical protein
LPIRIDPGNGRIQFQKVLNFLSRNISESQVLFLMALIFLMTKNFPIAQLPKKKVWLEAA